MRMRDDTVPATGKNRTTELLSKSKGDEKSSLMYV